jgi:hypothetical protein
MDDNLDDWEEKRKGYLTVAILCFIIGTYFFMKVKSESYVIKPSDLKVVKNLITSNKPKFKETTGKHGRKWIEFKCVNNKTTFEITSFDYRCANDNDLINEINIGDTISIKISKNDIENFDKETTCEIHSLVKNKKQYLDIKCRNKADNKDGEMGYIMLFAITIMTGAVYSFSQKPKIFDEVDPRVPIWIVIIILFFVLR